MGTVQETNDVTYLTHMRNERRGAVPTRSRPIGADTVFAQQWVREAPNRPASGCAPARRCRAFATREAVLRAQRAAHPTLAALTASCRGPRLRPKGRHAAIKVMP